MEKVEATGVENVRRLRKGCLMALVIAGVVGGVALVRGVQQSRMEAARSSDL